MNALFDHPALFYRGDHDYVDGVTSFVRAGLDAHHPVLVVVPGQNLSLVAGALGADAERVRLADMTVAGRNPGRILPDVLLDFAAAHPGRRVRIVGEPIWFGRPADEYSACVVHEALINVAFEGRDAAILCPYDAARLDAAVLDDATRTHPTLTDGHRTWPSPGYVDPFALAADHNLPLPHPPADAATLAYTDERDLRHVRRFVADLSRAALSPVRLEMLVLAVNELATNTVEHTGGPGDVRCWREPGRVVCEVEDTGHIKDPMAGRIPPPPNVEGKRGLVLVNKLADLVRIHTVPGRTTIRLYFDAR